MIRHKNKAAAFLGWLLILVLLFLIALVFLPCYKVLSISGRKNPAEVYYSHSACKNGFVISYTHSVNKGRVHDHYSIDSADNLVLNKTVFVSYGAGIPEPEETPGAIFTHTEDGYEISNIDRSSKQFVMAVGIIANHSITVNEKEYFLTDYFEPQTSLILEIKRISFVQYILKKL